MYDTEIKLSPDEILQKEFKYDAKGYRPKEVDEYLDIIIEDYNKFINLTNRLEKENRQLKEDNNALETEIRKLKIDLEAIGNSNESAGKFSTNNVDLLKRLSNLEKIVYGKNE